MDNIDISDFKKAVGSFVTGVTVVTTLYDQHMIGLTINSFTSVSLDPPLILFCLDQHSSSLNAFKHCEFFTINILNNEQTTLSNHFAYNHRPDKWSDINYETSIITNNPLISDCIAYIECKHHQQYAGGDHLIFIGKVISTRIFPKKSPLTYFRSSYNNFNGN